MRWSMLRNRVSYMLHDNHRFLFPLSPRRAISASLSWALQVLGCGAGVVSAMRSKNCDKWPVRQHDIGPFFKVKTQIVLRRSSKPQVETGLVENEVDSKFGRWSRCMGNMSGRRIKLWLDVTETPGHLLTIRRYLRLCKPSLSEIQAAIKSIFRNR
jgi:hypothetical protein